MTIYLLIKESYCCGEFEDQEITAYADYYEAQAIASAFENYVEETEKLEEEYKRLDLRHHPELKGQLGQLKKENRARYWAIEKQARAQDLADWSRVYVSTKEVK